MPGFLIIAHAPLASALKSVALHAFPDCGQTLQVLDVPADMTPEEIEAQTRGRLALIEGGEAIVFTDVFGATPTNVAARVADGQRVKVIAGVNVPMLFRSLSHADEPLNAVVARAISGATQGVMQVATSRPQNQTFQPGSHGQDPNHDQ